MPIQPKYKLITYKVVSVHPCITDPNKPTKLSGPLVEKILFKYANEALPDIGLTIASGKISRGILLKLITLLSEESKKFRSI